MSTEKFKKSVILPAPKSSSLGNALAIAFSCLAVSLLTNIILIAQYSQESYNKKWWYHAYFAQRDQSISLEHKIDDLEQKLYGLQPDTITSAWGGEIKTLWNTEEQFCPLDFTRHFVFNQNAAFPHAIFRAYLAKTKTRRSWPLSTLNR